jgi:preprotein translocase subunit SecA
MDYLRAGIHLRAMANRDPVVEYQREGFDMFNAMLDGIKEESVGFLFNLEVQTQEQQEAAAREAQAAAEAEALARAEEGTRRVLARQAEAEAARAAEADAAGPAGAAAPVGSAATTVTAAPAGASSPAPAAVPSARPSARRSGRNAGSPAAHGSAAPAPAEAVPNGSPSGTGPELAVKGLDAPQRSRDLSYSAPGLDASAKESGRAKAAKTATVTGTKEPARNAPCPCGSGKKYKACHGRPGQSL